MFFFLSFPFSAIFFISAKALARLVSVSCLYRRIRLAARLYPAKIRAREIKPRIASQAMILIYHTRQSFILIPGKLCIYVSRYLRNYVSGSFSSLCRYLYTSIPGYARRYRTQVPGSGYQVPGFTDRGLWINRARIRARLYRLLITDH